MKTQLLIFSILVVYTFLMYMDIIIFMLKSAPHRSLFSKLFWRISFLTGGLVVYFIINDYKFF